MSARPVVAFINAEGKGRYEAQLSVLIRSVVERHGANWAAICIAECDYLEKDIKDMNQDFAGHRVLRHYPGVGSRALKVVINRVFQDNVMAVMWKGRSGRLDFRFPILRPDGSSCFDLLIF